MNTRLHVLGRVLFGLLAFGMMALSIGPLSVTAAPVQQSATYDCGNGIVLTQADADAIVEGAASDGFASTDLDLLRQDPCLAIPTQEFADQIALIDIPSEVAGPGAQTCRQATFRNAWNNAFGKFAEIVMNMNYCYNGRIVYGAEGTASQPTVEARVFTSNLAKAMGTVCSEASGGIIPIAGQGWRAWNNDPKGQYFTTVQTSCSVSPLGAPVSIGRWDGSLTGAAFANGDVAQSPQPDIP